MCDRKGQTRKRVRKHRAIRKACKDDLAALDSFASKWKISPTREEQEINRCSHSAAGRSGNGDENDSDQHDIDPIDDVLNEACFEVSAAVQSSSNDDLLQLENQTADQPVPVETETSEAEEIRLWALENNITQLALDQLLEILRKRMLPNLPKTSKTFLKTSTAEYHIEQMEDSLSETCGEFAYFGIESGLKSCVNAVLHDRLIELQFNVDGLPLSKSGTTCFWPILCKVHFSPDIYKPFPVAIYSGYSKPKYLSAYLDKLVAELNDLQTNGIVIDRKTFEIGIKCFICDTPARAFLKGTKGHRGYSACERCTVYGQCVRVGNGSRVVYPGINHPKRTYDSFKNQTDPEHHNHFSPLLDLTTILDMIIRFILDYMHLGCIGAMKKLLEFWLFGPLNVRLGRNQKMEINRRLRSLKAQIPCEFQRKIRPIDVMRKWKATEFRFFLLYCGPIVLKNVLPTQFYKHFILLHAAFRILCSEELAVSWNSKAKNYLEKFFLALPYLYGPASQVINMHNLVHLADDVRNMGCSLSRLSSFPFESALGQMKKVLRTPNRLLSQVCRRIHEKGALSMEKACLPVPVEILKSDVQVDLVHVHAVRLRGYFTIMDRSADNMVLLQDGSIMEIQRIYGKNVSPSALMIEGKIWRPRKSLYTYPCESKHFHIQGEFSPRSHMGGVSTC